MNEVWPRLSEDLTGPRDPEHCQSCGAEGELDLRHPTAGLTRWIEHDAYDRPEKIVVVLCKPCGDRIIEPHPRLYNPLPANAPFPGCMEICARCRHRDGHRCANPDLLANGGAGISMVVSRPTVIFLDARDKNGRRQGWQEKVYARPPRDCAGRDEVQEAAPA